MDYQPSISMRSIHGWQLKPALLEAGRATRLLPAQRSDLHLYANESVRGCEGGVALFTCPRYLFDEARRLYRGRATPSPQFRFF